MHELLTDSAKILKSFQKFRENAERNRSGPAQTSEHAGSPATASDTGRSVQKQVGAKAITTQPKGNLQVKEETKPGGPRSNPMPELPEGYTRSKETNLFGKGSWGKVLDKYKKDAGSKRVCRFFFSTSGCKQGDECSFLHPGL